MSQFSYDREGTARMIRTYFIEHKKAETVSRKYKPNPRHDNWDNWLVAADACIAAGANPRDWVDASFHLSRSSVFANQLGGPAALRKWQEYRNPRPVETAVPVNAGPDETAPATIVDYGNTVLRDDIDSEFDTAFCMFMGLTGSDDPKNNRAVLENRFSTLSSYVRVSIAGSAGMWDIVKQFKPQALDFLSTHPEHVQTLHDLGYPVKDYLNAV